MSPVWPGGTIGILGGGQLARMLALEARRMGYRVAVLDPDPDGPAGQVADVRVTGRLDDVERARALAALSDVVTLDTEHVPAELLADLETLTPVRPSSAVLRVVQDRLEQRRFVASIGVPQVRHASVPTADALLAAARDVGFPCVLKTRRSGYDGKGQARVDRQEDLLAAWQAIGEAPAVVEAFVDFEREVSVLLARALDGGICIYPIAENAHRRHILHTTRVPARIPVALARAAGEIGARIAAALGHVGMLAVELFVTRDGALLVNEIAPRTHNSGHYTFGACATSQFEQHVRAICGLPLGDPSLLRPAAMLNLLGDLWRPGPPRWDAVLARPSARLHLYGKKDPTEGRKMGHVLVVDDDGQVAAAVAESIAAELHGSVTSDGSAFSSS
ncbi:MAG: 5-(carboxyamino)imidazole ribonucleotide synthase [Thermoanaerobaculia bacterium]